MKTRSKVITTIIAMIAVLIFFSIDYNAYLGFSTEDNTAVVVLSNLSPNYKIPATVLGRKILTELTGK